MSFSSNVKNELSKNIDGGRNVRLSELVAIMGFCGNYIFDGSGHMAVVFGTEHFHVMRSAYTLIRRLYHYPAHVSVMRMRASGKNGKFVSDCMYTLTICNKRVTQDMLTEMGLMKGKALVDPERPLLNLIPEGDNCKRAFLKGLFLCRGLLSDPNKSYHFEISADTDEKADEIKELISQFGIKARKFTRKSQKVVYVKDAESVSDLLGILGATSGLLEFENIRILKDIGGQVNRQVNCETANLKKTVNAGAKQIKQIELIKKKKGLKWLPEDLQEIAKLRLENPDVSLAELGKMLNPPLGKSGIYHRFERIENIAAEIEK